MVVQDLFQVVVVALNYLLLQEVVAIVKKTFVRGVLLWRRLGEAMIMKDMIPEAEQLWSRQEEAKL